MSRRFSEVSLEHIKNKQSIVRKLPTRATKKSSGYDFYLPIKISINPNERVLVWSDIKAYMNDDEELLIFPRSSLGIRGLVISNTIGKIDSDYVDNPKNDGNIGLTLWNTSDTVIELSEGERVCQGSFYKYLITDNDVPLSDTRDGGMGSTGK
jgi:dUTP pyrophosphatase